MDTYVILQVVYGYQLKEEIPQEIQNLLSAHFVKKTPGFLSFRSNKKGEKVNTFGIVLDKVDENNCVEITNLNLKANNENKKELEKLLNMLEPQLQEYFSTKEANEFILWTQSEPDTNFIVRELSAALYEYAYACEAWDYTGSSEDREEKGYNEAWLDDVQSKYGIYNFCNTPEGKKAYAAGVSAYLKTHLDEEEEDED